ncbi:MAG: GNAT family protein [Candidatus Limnocylindrales bacterium]
MATTGRALYHITIGEKDAWGRGFGGEATRLMLDHAFTSLGLHRIALYVFQFNERAIRAYRRAWASWWRDDHVNRSGGTGIGGTSWP